MPLSQLQVLHVCKLNANANETCRYLTEDSIADNQYHCMKLTGQKKHIDEAVEDYLRNNADSNDNAPLGNNCSGYPIMRHKIIGYDQKK